MKEISLTRKYFLLYLELNRESNGKIINQFLGKFTVGGLVFSFMIDLFDFIKRMLNNKFSGKIEINCPGNGDFKVNIFRSNVASHDLVNIT